MEQSTAGETVPLSAGAPLVCGKCSQPVLGSYYAAQGGPFAEGTMVCAACEPLLRQEDQADPPQGTALRALGYGVVAALGAGAVRFAVVHWTGYDVGFLAILIGMAIGHAVFVGSYRRGGYGYQALAAVLCYLAVAGSNFPLILAGLAEQPATELATDLPAGEASQAEVVAAPENSELAADEAGAMLAVVAGVALVSPFLAVYTEVTKDSLMGLVLLGVGIATAIGRAARRPLALSGPFSPGQPAPAAGV